MKQIAQKCRIATAMHRFENPVIHMLNRDIQIFDNFRLLRNGINHFLCDFIRIQVMQPYPSKFHAAQLMQQFRQHLLVIQISAITGDILCYHNEFPYTGIRQCSGFL